MATGTTAANTSTEAAKAYQSSDMTEADSDPEDVFGWGGGFDAEPESSTSAAASNTEPANKIDKDAAIIGIRDDGGADIETATEPLTSGFVVAKRHYEAATETKGEDIGVQSEADGGQSMTACTESQPNTGIRFTNKSRGCGSCGGPCGLKCSKPDPPTVALQLPGDAADAFAAAVQRHKIRKLEEGHPIGIPGPTVLQQPSAAADAFAEAVQRHRKRKVEEAQAGTAYGDPSSSGPRRKKRKRAARMAEKNFGIPPSWFDPQASIGKKSIHESHHSHLAWHRGMIWCWACGNTATTVLYGLGKVCRVHEFNEKPTISGTRQLKRLKRGLAPIKKVGWPLALDVANNLRA
jgi:hypothetical protein